MRTQRWSLAATLMAVLVVGSAARGAEVPPKSLAIVIPSVADISVTGINDRGDLVGFEWAEDPKRPGVLEQKPFYARGKSLTYLPLLSGYTATFPEAVSNEGVVVGRVSKPAPLGISIPFRNLAFIWDARQGIRSLGVLKDDNASFATGISRDGRRISGFSVGNYRVRACVWDLEADGKTWVGTAMPQTEKLGSNTVAISGNGRFVTAVDGTLPCLWSRNDQGTWTREVIGESASLIPRAVNNSGVVVGIRFGDKHENHAVVWSRAEGYRVIKEPGAYRQSIASAVNNQGTIVGMIDGLPGSSTGPNAFVYEAGWLRIITEAGPRFSAATVINDDNQTSGVFEDPEHDVPAVAPPTTKSPDR